MKTLLSFRAGRLQKSKEMTKRKSALESTTLPGKLADCSEKDASKCEIFIVEETLQEVKNKAETEDSRLFYLFGVKCQC